MCDEYTGDCNFNEAGVHEKNISCENVRMDKIRGDFELDLCNWGDNGQTN